MADILSSMISTINNASKTNISQITIKASKFCIRILDVLKKGGYIRGYKYENPINHVIEVTILLKYTDTGKAIREIRRISSSGKRVYWPCNNIKPASNGFGNFLISTSRGVLFDTDAKLFGAGGEVICYVR